MNEFQPKLVLDSRINDITDKIDIAVESSAAEANAPLQQHHVA